MKFSSQIYKRLNAGVILTQAGKRTVRKLLRQARLRVPALQEVAGRSQDLSALGSMGLAALDAIAKRQPAPDLWKTQQLATIEELKKPKAQLLLMPVPVVQKLVEAAAAGGTCAVPSKP